MARFIISTALALGVVAAPAQAHGKWSACGHAKPVRRAVIKKFGQRAPGRDICEHGKVKWNGKVRRATFAERVRYLHVLRRMNMPPRVTRLLTAAPPSQPPAGTLTARAPAGGTLAAIRQCESGGNYHAVSPDGTYRGGYQFDYGTWRSIGGTGDPAAAPPWLQDELAAKLHAERGSSPWPVCGR